ncbi:MAG: hypothetical protein A2505_05825 [Deltaproteobacteria bacterium RIFOXYD12_FULL_55_16]|nr:MAG: hypothetical protein A2505_05825 [Deltaproteobacteria bacterium RIFOXYD12_FULL_55_16]
MRVQRPEVLATSPPPWPSPAKGEGTFNKKGEKMAIASVVVATEAGAVEVVLAQLAQLPNTEVHGSKENQIVTVIEADSIAALSEGMQRLAAVAQVIGVYPVYAGQEE